MKFIKEAKTLSKIKIFIGWRNEKIYRNFTVFNACIQYYRLCGKGSEAGHL